MNNVCVLIPTLNESASIGMVIDDLHRLKFNNILVIDGNSPDGTADIAEKHGARVIIQKSVGGKGSALIECLPLIEDDYILMLDGDGTNPPVYAEDLLAPVIKGECEHVIGNRLIEHEKKAFKRINLIGNFMINKLFKCIYHKDYKDILSGYHAFNRRALASLNLQEKGFGIETEIAIKFAKSNYKTKVIKTYYKARIDDSKTKLHPLRDGLKILRLMLKASC